MAHHQLPITSYLFAEGYSGGQVYQDDDCEDLCEAFADENPSAYLANNDVKETVPPHSKSVPPPMRPIKRSLWSDPKPTKCKSCHGIGSHECRFCGGVSFLSGIGGDTDALFFEGIGKSCPVCNDGNELCQYCAGTGYIFSWKNDRNVTGSMHP